MKITKPVSLQEMAAYLAQRGMIAEIAGNNVEIQGLGPAEDAETGDITFATTPDFFARAVASPAAAIVLSRKVYSNIRQQTETLTKSLLIVDNAGLAHAWLKQAYADWDYRSTEEWGRIHPAAVIHGQAFVHENALIGPNAVIGLGATIQDRAVLMAGVIVEREAHIGEGTILHPGVVIGRKCRIGKNCIVRSGAIIGSEGFGFAQDEHRHHHRIPQTGIVVIEDDCVIGANNSIDRAAYGETVIHRGTIMDGLCHIGHNVQVGEDSIILAQSGIAGSTTLGKRVICSGQTGVLDHINIPDDTILLVRAAVTESIEKSGVYGGAPLMPISGMHRLNTHLKNLSQLVRDVKGLKKQLEGQGSAPSGQCD